MYPKKVSEMSKIDEKETKRGRKYENPSSSPSEPVKSKIRRLSGSVMGVYLVKSTHDTNLACHLALSFPLCVWHSQVERMQNLLLLPWRPFSDGWPQSWLRTTTRSSTYSSRSLIRVSIWSFPKKSCITESYWHSICVSTDRFHSNGFKVFVSNKTNGTNNKYPSVTNLLSTLK